MPSQQPKECIPNYQLRRARKLRGLSQRALADKIGAASDKNVSRWECGKTVPCHDFQQMLVDFFGMSAEELGFLKEEKPDSQPLLLSSREQTAQGAESDGRTSQEAIEMHETLQQDATKKKPLAETSMQEEPLPDDKQQADQTTQDQEKASSESNDHSEQAPQETMEPKDEQNLYQTSHQDIKNYRINLSLVNRLQIFLGQHTGMGKEYPPDREELKHIYKKLLTIVQARLRFAGMVEAYRKYGSEHACKQLPLLNAELDTIERTFDEQEIWRTLLLIDNSEVWLHYCNATKAFERHKEWTKEVLAEALGPHSPSGHFVLRMNVLLNPALDEDPTIANIYREIKNESSAMLKAMKRRLQ